MGGRTSQTFKGVLRTAFIAYSLTYERPFFGRFSLVSSPTLTPARQINLELLLDSSECSDILE